MLRSYTIYKREAVSILAHDFGHKLDVWTNRYICINFLRSHHINIILIIVFQGFSSVFSRQLFVSHHGGKDVVSCGLNLTFPCHSIRFAVTVSKISDEILIDAKGNPYEECSNTSDHSIELTKSLSFVGINGRAVIQCCPHCHLFKVKSSPHKHKVIFSNLVISKTDTVIQCSKTNVELVFKQCNFNTYNIGVSIKSSTQRTIQIIDSSFEESGDLAISAKCINLTAHFTNTSFYSSPVVLQGFKPRQNVSVPTNQVFIFNCVFDGQRKQLWQELLAIKISAVVVNVTVHSSTFSNHYVPKVGKKNLAVFLLHDNSFVHKKITTLISLNKLLVQNNYSPFSGIHLTHQLKNKSDKMHNFKVELLNSIFRNNSGALRVSMRTGLGNNIPLKANTSMKVTNVTFLNNFNGYAARTPIFLGRGRTQFTSCSFLDNTAGDDLYAAVIYSGTHSATIFENCYYENTRTDTNSISVYGIGDSWLWFKGKNTFNISALKTRQTIFLHMPSLGIILDGSFRILCPRGYAITTKRQCNMVKKYCPYFYSSCQQCPFKQYSLERGELYTNMSERIVHCRNCPRGGLCEEGQVTAKPNFWGYNNKGRVSFLQCPPNYCCDKGNCQSYDGCHGNRTGTLCGQCPEGMSEPLFTTKCKANNECTNIIFWPGVLCYLIVYLLFFLYHEEITSFISKGLSLKLSLFSELQQRNGGFLKIIFYYYQIVHLFRNSVVSQKNNQIFGKLEKVISRAFNLIVINVPSFDCPFQNLRPVEKTVVLHSVGYFLLALIGFLYILTKVFKVVSRATRTNNSNQSRNLESLLPDNQAQGPKSPSLTVRMVSSFTDISLLMYSSSAELCLFLLHCVPVGDNLVLFIDGTIKCYQAYQYFLVGYVVFSILPFCVVPVLGSYLLRLGRISVLQFCIACIFPFPFCCFWMYLLLKNCSSGHNSVDNTNSNEETSSSSCNNTDQETSSETQHNSGQAMSSTEAILEILLGPFRTHEPVFCLPASRLPWEGFLIFRRLVLIIVLTFVFDSRLKMIVALIICVVILIAHMYVKPFTSALENLMETLSLGTLVVFSALTLVKALYQGEDFSSSAQSSTLLKSFDLVQDILSIIPLTIIIFFVTLSLLIRLIFVVKLCIRALLGFLGRLCTR